MNNKSIIKLMLLIAVLAAAFQIYSIQDDSVEDQVRDFIENFYSVTYDEYLQLQETSGGNDFEPFMQRDKYETFFSEKGYERFVANGQTVHYINDVINNRCDIRLSGLDGEFDFIEESSFQYAYTATVEIHYLDTGVKEVLEEPGVISGQVEDERIKIEHVKTYGYLFD